ncbi:Clp protease N-terminal domain-containing protein [Streptacidiphilus albus]|uniref:Clp protease N-terminal domain-containing protein n=1 Tax=Streptacidiphilus albus TaxID=105425 RepID=UPI00054C486F|nr:Clp protease N-terminal domain-containing protein [Streptacidiphilus albus]
MFDRFDELAKAAVVASQDAAIALGHDFIGTEHMLLGLACTAGAAGEVLREQGLDFARAREETVRQSAAAGVVPSGGKPAVDALSAIGIDVAAIQSRAEQAFGEGAFQFPRPAYTEHAKRAMVLTLREANEHGGDPIRTEHLLLGLLAEAEGESDPAIEAEAEADVSAATVLTALSVDVAALRPAVLARLAA